MTIFRMTTLLLFLSNATSGITQNTIKFTGRLVSLDGNKDIVQRVPIRVVNQGSGTTLDDGTFSISIQAVDDVTVELINSKWSIIYPVGGKTSLPRNANSVVDFYIGESTKDILTKAIARSNNEIKNRLSQLGLKQDGVEQILKEFRSDIQSMTNIKIEDLKNEIEIENQKKEFYPKLASSVTNYVNEAKDLKDAFRFVSKHAFEDPQALQLLTEAVTSYNTVFEDVNREHIGYENTVLKLWDEARSSDVRELFNYALGDLHTENIFALNLKLRDINEYFRGAKNSKKKVSKETIIHEIEIEELKLDRKLVELDKRAQVVLSRLSNS